MIKQKSRRRVVCATNQIRLRGGEFEGSKQEGLGDLEASFASVLTVTVLYLNMVALQGEQLPLRQVI